MLFCECTHTNIFVTGYTYTTQVAKEPQTTQHYILTYIHIFIYVCLKRESYVSGYSGPLVTNYTFVLEKSQDKKSVIVIPFQDDTFFFKNSSRILLTKEDSKKCDQCSANEILGLDLFSCFFYCSKPNFKKLYKSGMFRVGLVQRCS